MLKKIVYPGLFGTVVLIVWTIVVNGFFGFQNTMNMKKIQNEPLVYEMLKEQIVEPGRYLCNPQLTPEGMFPDNQPVFSVMYGGMGHEAAGGLALIGFLGFLFAPMIGTWMLSQTSQRILQSFRKKVLFFASIGLLCAVFADLPKYGIGGYPAMDALLLGIHDVVLWTLIGTVIAWRVQPDKSAPTA